MLADARGTAAMVTMGRSHARGGLTGTSRIGPTTRAVGPVPTGGAARTSLITRLDSGPTNGRVLGMMAVGLMTAAMSGGVSRRIPAPRAPPPSRDGALGPGPRVAGTSMESQPSRLPRSVRAPDLDPALVPTTRRARRPTNALSGTVVLRSGLAGRPISAPPALGIGHPARRSVGPIRPRNLSLHSGGPRAKGDTRAPPVAAPLARVKTRTEWSSRSRVWSSPKLKA